MGISVLRATGRLLVPVAAAALMAGISFQAAAAGDKGRIALNVGADPANTYFQYQSAGTWAAGETQYIQLASRGCTFSDLGSGDRLVTLSAAGNNKADLGIGPTSIGVYDGPTGVPCSRVSIVKGVTESLGLSLNTAAGSVLANKSANGFDRLEFDIEAKGDLLLTLEVRLILGSTSVRTRTYELRTGSQIVGSESPPGFEADPAHRVFNCSAASDSGSDSGANDNCRWIINDYGSAFTLKPVSGEFSLEGGGDYGADPSKNSFIYLTDINSGQMNCGGTVSTGFDNAQYCTVTLQEFDDSDDCTGIDYALLYGGDSCEFITPEGFQVVANAVVAYEPEDQVDAGTGDTWVSAPLSRIVFAKVDGSFPIPACLGLTLDNRTNPSPIPEVRDGGLFGNPGSYDLSGDNGTIEFACAYFRSENFLKQDGSVNGKAYIEEWVQFWSDPQLSRPGGGFSN